MHQPRDGMRLFVAAPDHRVRLLLRERQHGPAQFEGKTRVRRDNHCGLGLNDQHHVYHRFAIVGVSYLALCAELRRLLILRVNTGHPATENITLSSGVKNATLVNDKGKALRKADASGKLDVQNLPEGLYNLQMMRNDKLINQRIQVKH